MIAVLGTVCVVIATVGAGTFLWSYTAGNRWWTSRVGVGLVGQASVILLVLGYASLKRVFGWPTIPVVQLSLFGLVASIEAVVAVAFVRERRVQRARRSAIRLSSAPTGETMRSDDS